MARYGSTSAVEYARYADDLVVLVHEGRRWDWVLRAVQQRLREEFDKLRVEVNEEKSREVDLRKGEAFGFLGFDFRRVRSRRGNWCPLMTPQRKQRTALLRKLRAIFNRHRSQPLHEVVPRSNPILRGWVTYFAIGHSGRCFAFICNWVEIKLRRLWLRNRQRPGFGWWRWRWLRLGGDQAAAVVAPEPAASGLRLVALALAAVVTIACGVSPSSRASSIGRITSDAKSAGKRSAGNLHAPFEVAGVGNGPVVRYRAYPRPYSHT